MLNRHFLTQKLEPAVFLNLAQKVLLQIIFQLSIIRHLRQKLAALNQHELAGHDHVLARHFQLHGLQGGHISQILLDDLRNGHIINIHLVLRYKVEQQVQRAFKIF